MKTFLIFCFCAILSMVTVYGQDVTEPDFVGEVLMLASDNSVQPLEKTTIQEKTRLSASALIVGIGSAKTKISIEGGAARVKISQDGEHKLIVRAVDNNTDPLSIISVFRFDATKKERKAEIASANTFGGVTNNKLDFLPFSAKKYGESSYILTLDEKPAGEYGIIVRNPNTLNEGATVVATFAIE